MHVIPYKWSIFDCVLVNVIEHVVLFTTHFENGISYGISRMIMIVQLSIGQEKGKQNLLQLCFLNLIYLCLM